MRRLPVLCILAAVALASGPESRELEAKQLGQAADPASVDKLLRLLKDPDWGVRRAAVLFPRRYTSYVDTSEGSARKPDLLSTNSILWREAEPEARRSLPSTR